MLASLEYQQKETEEMALSFLKERSARIRALRSQLRAGETGKTPEFKKNFSLVFADQAKLLGRVQPPSGPELKQFFNAQTFTFFSSPTDTQGTEKYLAQCSPEELLTILATLERETVLEQKQTEQTLRYFEKHLQGISEETREHYSEQEQAIQRAATMQKELSALASLHKFPVELSSWISSLLSLQDLSNEELKRAWGTTTLQYAGHTWTLTMILGNSFVEELRRCRSQAEIDVVYQEIKDHIVSPKMYFFTLSLYLAKGNLSEADLHTLFRKTTQENFFSDLHTLRLIQYGLEECTDKESRAYFLSTQVKNGKISGDFARELFLDAQNDTEKISTLSQAYIESFLALITGLTDDEESSGKKHIRIPKALVLVLLAAALSTFALSQGVQPQKIFEDATHAIQDSFSTLSTLSEAFEELSGIDFSSQPQIEPTNAEKMDEVATQAELETAIDEFSLTTPFTADQIHAPSGAEGLSNGLVAGATSAETVRNGYLMTLWEMKRWSSPPDFLVAATYTHVDPESGVFSRFTPESERQGTVLTPLTEDALETSANVLVGERAHISSGWSDLPAFHGYAIRAGSIFVYGADGSYVGSYPIEFIASPLGPDQFFRPVLGPEDTEWIAAQGSSISFRLALQYQESVTEYSVVSMIEDAPIIPLGTFPVELQNLIQEVNADATLTDEQKFDKVFDWYLSFVTYSIDAQNDQFRYIDQAISNGSITPEERAVFYYKLFFGTGREEIGISDSSDSPIKGAGECTRLSLSLAEAFKYIQTSKPWGIAVESGNRLGPSLYGDTENGRISGATAHTRLKLYGSDGQELVYDSTDTPNIDTFSTEILGSLQTIEPTPATPSPTAVDEPVREYIPRPDVFRYATDPLEVTIPASDLENGALYRAIGKLDGKLRIGYPLVANTVTSLWQFSNIQATTTDGFPDTSVEDLTPLFPIDSTRGFSTISVGVNTSTEYVENVLPDIEFPRRNVSYTVQIPPGTNIIPLLITTNYRQYIDQNTIDLTLANGQEIENFRIESSGFDDNYDSTYGRVPQSFIVIDLPANLLSGRSINVSYAVGSIDYSPPDKGFDFRNTSRFTVLTWQDAYTQLSAVGFTEEQAAALYIQYYFQNLDDIDNLPQLSQEIENLPIVSDETVHQLQFLVAYHQFRRNIFALDARRTSEEWYNVFYDFFAEQDRLHPLLGDYYGFFFLSPPSSGSILDFYDKYLDVSVSDASVFPDFRREFESFSTAYQKREHPPLAPYIMKAFLYPGDGDEINKIDRLTQGFGVFLSSFRNMTIEWLPELYINRSVTLENSSLTYCDSTTTGDKFTQCLLSAPYTPLLATPYLERVAMQILTKGALDRVPSDVPTLSLSPDGRYFLTMSEDDVVDTERLSGISGRASFLTGMDLSTPYRSIGTGLIPAVTNHPDDYADIRTEMTKTFDWYIQQSLQKGVLFTGTVVAPLLYAAMRMIAGQRRYTKNKRSRKAIHQEVERIGSQLGLPAEQMSWIEQTLQNPRGQHAKQLDEMFFGAAPNTEKLGLQLAIGPSLGGRGENSDIFRLGQKSRPPYNPWNSREVTPAYTSLIQQVTQSGIIEQFTPIIAPSHPIEAKNVLLTALHRGVGNINQNFTLLRKAPTQWEKSVRDNMLTQLREQDIAIDNQVSQAIDDFINVISPLWQTIAENSSHYAPRNLVARAKRILRR